jgi:hypothetical protein
MLKFSLIAAVLLTVFYWQGSTQTTARNTVDYTGSVTDRPRVTMTERHGAIPVDRTLSPGETVVE